MQRTTKNRSNYSAEKVFRKTLHSSLAKGILFLLLCAAVVFVLIPLISGMDEPAAGPDVVMSGRVFFLSLSITTAVALFYAGVMRLVITVPHMLALKNPDVTFPFDSPEISFGKFNGYLHNISTSAFVVVSWMIGIIILRFIFPLVVSMWRNITPLSFKKIFDGIVILAFCLAAASTAFVTPFTFRRMELRDNLEILRDARAMLALARKRP